VSETPGTTSFDFAAAVRGLWRRKWVILGLGLIGLAAAVALSYRGGISYTSTAKVWVKPTTLNPAGSIPLSGTIDLPTEAALVTSQQVGTLAAKTLGVTVGEALDHVSASYPPAGFVLYVSYSASTPQEAQDGARAFADAYLQFRLEQAKAQINAAVSNSGAQIAQLESQLKGASRADTASIEAQIGIWRSSAASMNAQTIDPGQIINPAGLPGAPTGPGHTGNALRGLVLGLIVGLVAALFQERMAVRRS
jgi:uncharacterized protein involved in exopolysaccharide biosynthesis